MPRTYTLLRTLGRGSHGAVHLAEMRDDEGYVQPVAVKRLLPQWSSNKDLGTRLKDEARLLALLRHDHVVQVYGMERIQGAFAVVMEFVEGVDLARLMERHGAFAPKVCLDVTRAVADALDAAWNTSPPSQGPLRVVHRDIKPSNVMLTTRGGVKVMDFGVARATFEAREGETRSQQFGTARYMAPERWLHGDADHRSDVFSLGVTLIELASGASVSRFRLSNEGYAEDRAAALAGIEWEPLRALADRMCAFDPTQRPTADRVVAACEDLLASAPGPTLRAWAAEHVVPEPGEPVDPTIGATVVVGDTSGRSTTFVSPPAASERRWMAGGVGIGLALAVALLAAWGLRPDPVPPPAIAEVVREPEPAAVIVAPPPAPAIVAPAPAPLPPIARPEPREKKPSPAPIPAPETVYVRFLLDPGISADTEYGAIQGNPGVLRLPQNSTIAIRVHEAGKTKGCTIQIGTAGGTVRIEKGATCKQSSS